MAQLDFNRNLVRGQGETTRNAGTHQGQAAWGVGPNLCKECRFFAGQRRSGAPGRCEKYSQLMQGRDGPRFPPTALSCRFFEPSKS